MNLRAPRQRFQPTLTGAPRGTIHRGALLFWLCTLLFSACLPLPEPVEPATPAPTETASPTPTPTVTIVWFPPTATFTPLPSVVVQPTADLRPALGETLLEDNFTGEPVWPVSRSAVASAAYGQGEFTLAVTAEDGMVSSLRPEPELSDYYLEIEAFPSLCRGQDAYGLMLRAQSLQDYYRVLFTCNGQARVERVRDGKVTPLQDWVSSGQVAPGALVRARLGVWALGDELRIFVNDSYQFSVRDPLYRSGKIGLIARAAADTPLTVSFSNLLVRQVDRARVPTRTPIPLPTASPTSTRRPPATP